MALAEPLSLQPLSSLWPDPRRVARSADCVLLLHLRDGSSVGAGADEYWLLHNAPAWRLATTLLRPALLVLRLDRRQGCTLTWRSPFGHWHPVWRLVLPGSRQRTVEMMPPRMAPVASVAAQTPPAAVRPPSLPGPAKALDGLGVTLDVAGIPVQADDRDSRQRGGLGPAAHARLQQGTLGLVGLGRTGSAVAGSAARLGWRVLGLDPDVLDAHNLDADFVPLHEGWPKARALQKSLHPIARPVVAPDMRALSVDSPAAGALLAHCDLGIITMVDNLPSLVWAAAWALATLQVHVCVATGLDAEGGLAEIEMRLLLPGRGCPVRIGGLAAPLVEVRQQIARGEGPGTPEDYRQQRLGSVRSVSIAAGHPAMRTLEQVVQGRLRHSLFRRLCETAEGGLTVQDQQV